MLPQYIGLFIFYIEIVYSVPYKTNISNEVRVNKCCEKNQIYIERHCTVVKQNEEWRPLFISEKGSTNIQVNYK